MKYLFECWLCGLTFCSDDPNANSCSECFEMGKRIYNGTAPGLTAVDGDYEFEIDWE